jgi:hypothetical protein
MVNSTSLNLSFPKDWNDCSLSQLEQVASVLIDCAERCDRFHPFDMREVKVALFFLMSELKIVEGLTLNDKGEEAYIVRHPSVKEPFFLELWKLNSFIDGVIDIETLQYEKPEKEQDGVFDWLDDENHSGPLLFPYEKVTTNGRFPLSKRTYKGVAPLMQDFTWQRYRHCQDWLEEYLRRENIRIHAVNKARGCPADSPLHREVIAATKEADDARAAFLSELITGRDDKDHLFRDFDKVKWQVILFWWSEQMHYLHRTYPRCFKKQRFKGKKPHNPFELYTRTIATMEKYLGLDEDKVNSQTYTLVLQHLEDMAKESEEIEKMKRKK